MSHAHLRSFLWTGAFCFLISFLLWANYLKDIPILPFATTQSVLARVFVGTLLLAAFAQIIFASVISLISLLFGATIMQRQQAFLFAYGFSAMFPITILGESGMEHNFTMLSMASLFMSGVSGFVAWLTFTIAVLESSRATKSPQPA